MKLPRTQALHLSILLTVVAIIVGSVAFARLAAPAVAQTNPPCSGVITGTIRLAALPGASIRPAAGAHVRLTAVALGSGSTSVVVESAADGTYRHEGVCDGAYTVRAELPTPQGSLTGSYDADRDGVADVLLLTPTQRSHRSIDIAVSANPLNPTRPDPTATARPCAINDGAISGTVYGPDGLPFAGAAISLRGANSAASGGVPGKSAVSAADGSYRLAELCGGGYQVNGYARANPGQPGPLSGSYDADGDGRPDVVVLADASRHAQGIDIHLRLAPTAVPAQPSATPTAAPPTGPQIGGRCAGAIAGTVTDREGHAVAGARVLALGRAATNPSSTAPTTLVALSGSDGSFRLAPLCNGSFDIVALTVSAAGVDTGLHDPDGDHKPNTVVLSPQQPVLTAIDVTMPGLDNVSLRPRIGLPIEPVPGR